MLPDLWTNIRLAFRMLRKDMLFTTLAVAALAVGIGENTAMFSSVNAMLVHPFSFPELDRVMAVWEAVPKAGVRRSSIAPANYLDWQKQNSVFESLAAERGWSANLTGSGDPEYLEALQVTPNFFAVTSVPPLLGRTFLENESRPGHARVTVISYAMWQRQFAADPGIVNKSITLNGESHTIVGVMPREFDFPPSTALWRPLVLAEKEASIRDTKYLRVIGRLKPSVSLEQARAEMQTISSRLAQAYPETNAGLGVSVVPLAEDASFGSRGFVLVLMGAAFFLLLLACANVANMQLARATSRQREIAIRIALGASRARVFTQLLIESAVLSIIGGMLGVLLAGWNLSVSRALIPAFIVNHVAGLKNLRLDPQVLLFTVLMSLLAGVLSGIAPALSAFKANVNADLKDSGPSSSSIGHMGLRNALVISEVFFALVLVVGAGLMVQGFRGLVHQQQGFNPEHVLTMKLTIPEARYGEPAKISDLFEQLVLRIRTLPGVEQVAVVNNVPSGWSRSAETVGIENQMTATQRQFPQATFESVTPAYFSVMQIPLVSGRVFTTEDDRQHLRAVMVSRSFAQRHWPGQEALGRRLRLDPEKPNTEWRQVVGVVGDVKWSVWNNDPDLTIYVPQAQTPTRNSHIVLRASGDPLSLAAVVRKQVTAIDAQQPVYDIRTMQGVISDDISGVEFSARSMGRFAVIALILAIAGIYAVMAYSVSRRTREIGIRMALGADRRNVVRLILSQAIRLGLAGIALGIPVTIVMTRMLASTLLGTIAVNPAVLAGLAVMVALVTGVAGYLPARRAASVDPLVALRYE